MIAKLHAPSVIFKLSGLLSLSLLLACSPDESQNSDMGLVPVGTCPGNANVSPDSAAVLAAGAPVTGYVCPAGNQHWYKITVPDGQRLVTVNLSNDTPLSPVTLTYTLRGDDGMVPIDQPPPPRPANAKQRLTYTHCVPKAGTYYIQVQATGSDTQDPRNPFTLSYTPSADPNSGGSANNTPAGALDVGASQSGFIVCKGERRYYKVNVPASNLLQVSLTTQKATPALNLKYTILDSQQNSVGSDAVANGAAAPTALQVVRAVPAAGTYLISVADQADSGSDLANPFTLRVSAIPEPDAQDKPTRNDTPAAASSLGSFTCNGAGLAVTRTAYLASRADIDWYQVTVQGTGANCPATLDVGASWSSSNGTLQPQVLLAYADSTKSCTTDMDCRLLNKTCDSDNACTYLGNQCAMPDKKCTGASLCLPGGMCGVIQHAKAATKPTAAPFGVSVRTSQPLVPGVGTYFVGVRDFVSQGYDQAAPYALNVRADTDVGEPNNFYSPYVTPDNAVVRGDAAFLMRNKITLGQTITSRIGYERDQDFYVLDHPCPGADCTLSVTYSTSKDSGVLFTYQVEVDGKLIAGWPAAPATRPDTIPKVNDTVFGDGVSSCFFASKKQTGPYLFWVADLLKGGPKWDVGTSYSFTVRKVMDGCSDLCKNMFGCGQ